MQGAEPSSRGGFLASLLSSHDEEAQTDYVESSGGPSLLERARTAVGLQPTRREQYADACCPALTYQQRLWGFGICFGVGCLISLSSVLFFRKLLAGNPVPFALNYTVGNLIGLASTAFFVGPARQCKRMSHPTRAGAALIFVLAMVSTLVCALLLPVVTKLPTSVITLLVLVSIVIQFLAFFWYCLSYIPYGRRVFKACCASALSDG